MTDPTQSVHVRRVYYASGTPPVLPVLYDDSYDSLPNTDVLDPVLQYDGQRAVQGYTWDGTRQVAEGESDPIGDALRADAVAYWKMDEASGPRADSTAHGNTLSPTGTCASGVGIVGNCAAMNIMDAPQYLSSDTNTHLETGAIDFSFALWAKLNSKDDTSPIINKASGFVEYRISYDLDLDVLAFELYGASAYANTYGSPPISEWIFIVGTYQVSIPRTTIIINASVSDFVDEEPVQQSGNGALSIGAQPLQNKYADALIDEVGFWKRLLTQAEIDYLYNSGSGRTLYP